MKEDRQGISRHELLEKRMLDFAVNVIQLLEQEKTLSPRIADQLIRSCSSIGANYAEACNSASKLDFRNKIFIAKKEAAETRYWIDLVIALTHNDFWKPLRQESHELLSILQAIINSLKEKSAK